MSDVRYRALVARLDPTPEQAALLDGQGHTARALWNLLHEWYTCRDGGIARRPPVAALDRQLRQARTSPLGGWEWLAKLPAQATQQVLKHYLRAWERYRRGLAGRPRFKSKRDARLAVDVPQASALHVVRVRRRWGEVSVPLVGRVRFRWTRALPGVSRDCPGRVTDARLIRGPLGWQVVFRIEQPVVEAAVHPGAPVGVDRGVVHTMALSDGRTLDMPRLLTLGERRRLRRLERQAARRRAARAPGLRVSKRERGAYRQVAGLRARQARRRADWLHKATTGLAENHGLVVLEGLRVRHMTRAARGTVGRPGRNVRAKAGLNRSILGMAWGTAERMLAYKCPDRGGVLVTVPAGYSSQTCARCGQVAADSRRSRDRFACVACGHAAPADTNAAQVVLARGLAARSGTAPGYGVAGRGALAAGRAVKRQPPLAAARP